MELSEKNLIYRTAGEYLRVREPEEIEEFEVVFDSTFGTLNRQLAADSAPVVQEAHGRLRFDSPFVDVTAIASVTWIVTLLVRAIVRGPGGAEIQDILRRLDVLEAQLVEYTGQRERVEGIATVLQRRVEDLARLWMESREVPIRETATSTQPVDLLLRVRTRPVQGGLVLDYELTTPSGHLDLQSIEAESDRLNVADLKREHVRLFSGLERLLRQLGEDGEPLLGEEIGDELLARGQDLYLRLFPDRLKDFYRRYRDRIRSLLVVSDEPWVPWELIRLDEFEDDDFLCMRFPMGRWFGGQHSPAPAIQVKRLLCAEAAEVEDYPVLRFAREERQRLAALVTEVPGLAGEILEDARLAELTDRLKGGGFDLIHFAGHADHGAEDADRSKLLLTDRPFPTSRIAGEIQRRIAEDRPLVVLNACRAARAGLALTGVGGWPDRWVRLGRCGALLCPHWAVRDRSSGTFAQTFYGQLREGATLGEAVLAARRRLREADPADPTFLAYSLYGHPNAVVGFGDSESRRGYHSRRAHRDQLGLGTESGKVAREVDPGGLQSQRDPWVARIERFSEIAADDADLVVDDQDGELGGDVRLSQELYIERQIEPELRRRLLAGDEGGCSLSVIGDAGCGKTSLLWSLYRWLHQQRPEREVWFLKAGLVGFGSEPSGDYPTAEALTHAAGTVLDEGRPLAVLIDTADIRLRESHDRESLSALLAALLDLGADLVVSCRPQEARRLPLRIRGKKPLHLEGYGDRELAEAIRRHVASFYARPDIRSDDENLQAILRTVARGKPLREVCENPLTLRMLFALYAPERIHDLEINVCRLYGNFWRDRVQDDRRAGRDGTPGAHDLSVTAGAAALAMLAEGKPEMLAAALEAGISHFNGDPREVSVLRTRGVLRRSAQGTIRFFHQTFFEHAAARGLLGTRGVEGLEWAHRRFLGALDDLFLAPVFEQALILAEDSPGYLQAQAAQMLIGLLGKRHPSTIRSGFYVYAHQSRPQPAIGLHVTNLLGAAGIDVVGESQDEGPGKTDSPTAAWLDYAPNIAPHRLPQLFEEIEVVWQRGGWKTRRRVLGLLERLAVREPSRIQRIAEEWQILDWLVEQPTDYQADREVLRIGVALLEDDPTWAWGFLAEVYGQALEAQGYGPSHAEIARAIACGPDTDEATLADRFEARFPRIPMPRIVPVVVDAHAGLWRRQWLVSGSDAVAISRRLVTELDALDDLPLYARLSALAESLRDSDAEVAEEAFERLSAVADRRIRSKYLRLTVSRLLRGREPAARVYRRRTAASLDAALQSGMTADVRLLVDAVRTARPSEDELSELLAAVDDPQSWLRSDRLLPVLGMGLAAGLAGARQAVDRVIADPRKHSARCLGAVSNQLLEGGPESELPPLAYRLAIVCGDVKTLLHLLKSCKDSPLDFFRSNIEPVRRIVEHRSRSDRNPLIRRQAVDVWRHLVRLKLVEPPVFKELASLFRGEPERRAQLAWLRLMAAASTAEQLPSMAAFWVGLRDESPDPVLRDEARDLLALVVGDAEEPVEFLEDGIIAATRPTVGPQRVGHLSKALNRLCRPATVGLVLRSCERIFDACRETRTSLSATQDVGNKLTSVVLKAFRVAEDDLRQSLIERCRDLDFELARIPIAAAFALPDPAPRRWLDEMLDDESVPERTRDLIRRHKYYTERPEGSGGYRELYRLFGLPKAPSGL